MSGGTDFLLELLSEEIPARMQAKARNDLARMMAEALAAAGLAHGGITTYSTPRRLVLIARDLPAATEAVSEELKGPKTAAPSQALEGFLRKTGLTQDQLQDRDGVWFAVIDKPGRPTTDVLAQTVAAIVRDFAWPKSMRWGAASASSASMRWVRPLHSIVALLGDAIVPVAIDGVSCGASTLGHRFHHPGPITIGGAHDYVEKMRACHVLVDHAEREDIVRKGALLAAEDAGFNLVEDEGLVVENAGLTEWPVPLLGSFDADYLDVPPDVIQLTARTNQKYFVMRDGAGALAPNFVCVANIDANDGGAAIIAGNERVLAARLSDARFFWQQDLKVPLEEQAKKLEQIVFHEKLGTVADKVERVAKLARWLVEEGIVKGASADDAERAARLAKADLVTGMVGEFPELQGVIGGYLARAQGENDAVADAVRDHYKPTGLWDGEPSGPNGTAVALADKLDSLFAFFQAGMLPTGSKDPFALRRSGLGVIRIIERNALRLLISEAARHWTGGISTGPGLAVEDFLHDRLGVLMRESGMRYDMVQASTTLQQLPGVRPDGDLWRVRRRSAALQAFIETMEGANLLAGYKRAANILKKEQWNPAVASTAEILPDEAALAAALDAAEPTATAAIAAEDFTAAMSALASLRAPIDAFFGSVIVNDPDPAIRARRLNLLARFRDAVHAVADFSKIEG
ncbi:MAG: glycine--tRNA ligase subunit beta [Sphingomicrobium sp.]